MWRSNCALQSVYWMQDLTTSSSSSDSAGEEGKLAHPATPQTDHHRAHRSIPCSLNLLKKLIWAWQAAESSEIYLKLKRKFIIWIFGHILDVSIKIVQLDRALKEKHREIRLKKKSDFCSTFHFFPPKYSQVINTYLHLLMPEGQTLWFRATKWWVYCILDATALTAFSAGFDNYTHLQL